MGIMLYSSYAVEGDLESGRLVFPHPERDPWLAEA
jgi:hypothetical protein